MELNKKIPLAKEINEISSAIRTYCPDVAYRDIEVTFKCDPEMISKINEEFFYRDNPSTEGMEFMEADEVVVESNGITFKYIPR